MRTLSVGLAVAALAASQAPASADCECRANGRQFQQGQVACLKLPGGAQLARCGMELNNSSWKKVQDGCPSVANSAKQSWEAAGAVQIHARMATHDGPPREHTPPTAR